MKKLLICLPILLTLTGCDCVHTYEVTSTIINKDEKTTFRGGMAGVAPYFYTTTYYYFYFNELQEYPLSVNSSVFAKYDIGDIYTFTTNNNKLDMYFYETSYHLIVEDGN